MMDTEGSEVHLSEFKNPKRIEEGEEIILTVRKSPYAEGIYGVSYDAFIYDIEIGDEIVVDGGMVLLIVTDKTGPDVHCSCRDPGILLSRANLTFKRNQNLVLFSF